MCNTFNTYRINQSKEFIDAFKRTNNLYWDIPYRNLLNTLDRFILTTCASDHIMGAVSSQLHNQEENIISFLSKNFNDTQRNRPIQFTPLPPPTRKRE
ncbi:hypothetical protein COBT_002406 [Conglomerata obtusa]